ncbi:ribosomal protein S6 kinase alpha-5 [Condylostylus longicornis]|uniref:ribosomal protein S6 kinase alpha-5 n=1 Tax=Condylostylus longicornis TaxID=2530218 RepID=UPI00244E4BA5|nr:ribosomal protein S6 kinase alpha-5 [Condylostylus longicornis]
MLLASDKTNNTNNNDKSAISNNNYNNNINSKNNYIIDFNHKFVKDYNNKTTTIINNIHNHNNNNNNNNSYNIINNGGGGGSSGNNIVNNSNLNNKNFVNIKNHGVEKCNNYTNMTDKQQQSQQQQQQENITNVRYISDEAITLKRNSSGEISKAAKDNTERSDSVVIVPNDRDMQFEKEIEDISKIRTTSHLLPEDRVDCSHFETIKVLGTGAYGKVYLVRKKTGTDCGKLYAMKVLKKAAIVQKKKTAEHTKTERQVLELIRSSPFLVEMHYAFQTEERLYLVLDYVSGGELFTHLYKNEHFTEDEVRIYIAEIVLALEQLHKLGVIYRDIKLENILLDADGHIVITDFGLSKELSPGSNERAYSFCGTLEYMAPEIVRNNSGHDTAVDWWSVGVLTYELLTGASPFTVVEERNSQQDISRRILRIDPPIPNDLGADTKDFILKLLVKDPKKRLGKSKADASEIKSHPFFRKLDWEKLAKKQIKAPFKPVITNELDTSNFSEEFTSLPLRESTAISPPNSNRLFRGYSYVSPRHNLKRNPQLQHREPQKEIISNKWTITNAEKQNSAFYKEYDLNPAIIGTGSFSACFKCRRKSTNEEFAVKMIRNSHFNREEVRILRMCNHPHIVRLHECLTDSHYTYIVMELLGNEELYSRIKATNGNGLPKDKVKLYFSEILDVMYYLHSNNIVHCDLKPENILFKTKNSDILKLVDFGYAHYLYNDTEWEDIPHFTLDYAAPELLKSPKVIFSKACDIWALGVILYTMLCGQSPFRHNNNESKYDIRQNILEGNINRETRGWRSASEDLKDLIEKMLTISYRKRATIEQICKHIWVINTLRKSGSKQLQQEQQQLYQQDDNYYYIYDDRNNSDEVQFIEEELLTFNSMPQQKPIRAYKNHHNTNLLDYSPQQKKTQHEQNIYQYHHSHQPIVIENIKQQQQHLHRNIQKDSNSSNISIVSISTDSSQGGIESEGGTTSGLGRSKSSNASVDRATLSFDKTPITDNNNDNILYVPDMEEIEKLTLEKQKEIKKLNEININNIDENGGEEFYGFDKKDNMKKFDRSSIQDIFKNVIENFISVKKERQESLDSEEDFIGFNNNELMHFTKNNHSIQIPELPVVKPLEITSTEIASNELSNRTIAVPKRRGRKPKHMKINTISDSSKTTTIDMDKTKDNIIINNINKNINNIISSNNYNHIDNTEKLSSNIRDNQNNVSSKTKTIIENKLNKEIIIEEKKNVEQVQNWGPMTRSRRRREEISDRSDLFKGYNPKRMKK